MRDIRKWGNVPYTVVVVHGGPGAAGEMAPVAKLLSKQYGVLEPFQTAHLVWGQVDELEGQIELETFINNGNHDAALFSESGSFYMIGRILTFEQEILQLKNSIILRRIL